MLYNHYRYMLSSYQRAKTYIAVFLESLHYEILFENYVKQRFYFVLLYWN